MDKFLNEKIGYPMNYQDLFSSLVGYFIHNPNARHFIQSIHKEGIVSVLSDINDTHIVNIDWSIGMSWDTIDICIEEYWRENSFELKNEQCSEKYFLALLVSLYFLQDFSLENLLIKEDGLLVFANGLSVHVVKKSVKVLAIEDSSKLNEHTGYALLSEYKDLDDYEASFYVVSDVRRTEVANESIRA
ncbi:hypothetical protein [Halobacteriovorax sp. ZH2_bin.1]|uniref:hypothetical protein n=1 Tax=unclassified Halobacteriovorax TaxID=2639665 RepID=UPI00372066C0